MAFTTYTQLRDFLDGYTNNLGEIQGDPATIAGEAATAGLIEKDEAFYVQIIEVGTDTEGVGAAITHAITARRKHAEESGEPAEFIDGLSIAADIAADVTADITS